MWAGDGMDLRASGWKGCGYVEVLIVRRLVGMVVVMWRYGL